MFDMDIGQWIRELSLMAVPLLMALTFHEAAHGFVAYLLGDPTAKRMGRLTLNPIKHLDVLGTLVFVVTRMIGWAKPVPVDSRYFKNQARGMQLVALAGPGANFLLAVCFAIILGQVLQMNAPAEGSLMAKILHPLVQMLAMGMSINLVLGIFNLLPIPPMDGSNIVAGFLPRDLAVKYMSMGRWGMVLVILLAVSGLIGKIIWPPVEWSRELLIHLFIPI